MRYNTPMTTNAPKSEIPSSRPANAQSSSSHKAKMGVIGAILFQAGEAVHEAPEDTHHRHNLAENQQAQTEDADRQRSIEKHLNSVHGPRGINLRRMLEPTNPILSAARHQPDKERWRYLL